ncbi:hypothetical protein HNR46_000052 [Haloferula luteola]|uniref:Uncharacterized protein n=1 Tax=Haloferula luteola TaxID=595692 RepID=A0A840VA95_9BACT|nr:hypothetical protein [Haloferula luteola]MBB5349831.1 hypothetical protein [Haloferula luteola]
MARYAEARMAKEPSAWEMDKAVAAGILVDRRRRRKWLGGFAAGMIAMVLLGLLGIDDWLEKSLVRFATYWVVCGGWSLWVMLFAVFDALSVIKEEREKF